MSLPIFQIAAIVPVAVYLARCGVGLRRRNAQTWESLVARLQPDWSRRELSVDFLSKEGLNATPEETWERMHGVRGIRAMYLNAGVMLEMVMPASSGMPKFSTDLATSGYSLISSSFECDLALSSHPMSRRTDSR